MMAGSNVAVTLLIVLLTYTTTISSQPYEGDLRLFGGTDQYRGRIEIYHDTAWGTICDDGWSGYDATVACRQLGFTGSSSARCCASYGQGDSQTPIYLRYLGCDSNEDRLIDCSTSYGWGPHYSCDHYEDGGLECSQGGNDFRLYQINEEGGELEGVVEVFVNGRWGSVCADDWDKIDADVLCKQMKFTDSDENYNVSMSSSSSREIPVMGNIACLGNEDTLAECSHAGWGYYWAHAHEENIGKCETGIAAVKCRFVFGRDEIRLIGGGANEGKVEVYFDGEWGGICHDHWDIKEGKVACRQMGFPGALKVTNQSSYGMVGTDKIWLDDMACDGNEDNLAACTHDGWGYIGQCTRFKLAGVVCLLTMDGDIRLVDGSSETHSDGRLEIFHDSQWGSVCNNGWSREDSLVVCRHLGYDNVGSLSVSSPQAGGSPAWSSNVNCFGNETQLGECDVTYFLQRRGCSNGNHYVALSCSNASNKIRLVGGSTSRDGNVEIFHNGRWGTICPNDWDIKEVSVVCKYLGYSGEGAVRNRPSLYDTGSHGPTWLGGLNCTGSESNLAACPHPGWEKNGCNFAEQAGVVCHAARDGDIRLTDSGLNRGIAILTSGLVQVYHRGEWGFICGRGWDDVDAGVVCRQLGFSKFVETGTRSANVDDNTDGANFLLADVDCSGTESSILKCGLNGWQGQDCNETESVFVVCSEVDSTPPVVYECPRDKDVSVEVGSTSKPVFWMEPWAVDDAGVTTLLTNSHSPGISVSEGTTIVTYLFINAANLIAGCTFNINGIPVDSTPPIVTRCPSDIYFPVYNATLSVPVTWNEPSASDASNVTLVSSTVIPGTLFSVGSTRVMYDFMDGYDNHAYCNFTVNVIVGGSGQVLVPPSSDTPTVMSCPRDMTVDVELGSQGASVNWTDPWVTSPAGNGTLIAQTHASGNMFPTGRTTVNYIFADIYKQLVSCSFNVIGVSVDTTPPAIYQCNSSVIQDDIQSGPGAYVDWKEPFAIDAGGKVVVSQSHHPRTVFQPGTTTVRYDFTDESNNIASCVFDVTVSEVPTQGLIVSNCSEDMMINIEIGTYGTPVTWPVPIANSPSGSVSVIWNTHDSGDDFGVGKSFVEYDFIDGSGQWAQCKFAVIGTTVDTRPPEVSSCPTNQTVEIELGNNTTKVEWVEPIAFDISGGVQIQRSYAPGATFLPGITPVSYRFTDGAGNNSTCEFYVNATEVDTTPPTIHNCPRPIFVHRELDDPLPVVTWAAPTAADLSGDFTVTAMPKPGTVFNVNTTVVTYTFEDAAHNVASCQFEVNVREVDTRPPTIQNCPNNINGSVELGSGKSISWSEPTATDASNVVSRVLQTHKPGDSFVNGTHVVTYLFTDASRNMAKCEFNISINSVDTTKPIISQCPSDIVATAPRNGKQIEWPVPTAWDVSGIVSNSFISNNGGPGSTFPIGRSTVTYRFTDSAGNTAECSFDVNITGPPVIENCPSNFTRTIELGDYATKVTWNEPTLNPNSGTARLLHKSHWPDQAYFSLGKTMVSYVYIDSATYTVASCQFTVTIAAEDTKPPTILQCPSSIERIATSHSQGTIVTWTEPTATDPSNYTQTKSHTPGTVFHIGTTMVRYAFTDGSGNSNRAQCLFNVTVEPVDISFIDITSCPNDIRETVELGTGNKNVRWAEPVAIDPRGDVIIQSQSHHSGDVFPVGKYTVTYEFRDEAGHVAVCNFTVSIETVDTTPPTIRGCHRDISVNIEKGTWGKSVPWIEPTASDRSGTATLVSRTHAPDSLFYPGQTLVTYIFTDSSHNLANCSFHVNTIAEDTTPPVVTTCPNNITKIIDGSKTTAQIYWTPPGAIDASGDTLRVEASHNPGSEFAVGSKEVVYTFTDSAQNSASCRFSVTIGKETASLTDINCPDVIHSNTSDGNQECQTTWDEPKASDGTPLLFQTHAPGETIPGGSYVMVTYVFKNLASCTFTVKCSTVEQSKQIRQEAEFPLAIAAIVTAAFLGLCLLIVLVIVCVRRRNKSTEYPLEFSNEFTPSSSVTENPGFTFDEKSTDGL